MVLSTCIKRKRGLFDDPCSERKSKIKLAHPAQVPSILVLSTMNPETVKRQFPNHIIRFKRKFVYLGDDSAVVCEKKRKITTEYQHKHHRLCRHRQNRR
jgi:hypothetical protein